MRGILQYQTLDEEKSRRDQGVLTKVIVYNTVEGRDVTDTQRRRCRERDIVCVGSNSRGTSLLRTDSEKTQGSWTVYTNYSLICLLVDSLTTEKGYLCKICEGRRRTSQ